MAEPKRPLLHVLLVDDDELARRVYARVLRAGGEFRVTEAESGDDALFALRRHRFDAVLTDYRMPTMTGVELLEHVRVHDPHVRRVLMSSAPVYGLDGLLAGGLVHAFLAKPIDLARASAALQNP
jgi:CheY-like chemotaxis protein